MLEKPFVYAPISDCSLAAGSPGVSSDTQFICGVSFGLRSTETLRRRSSTFAFDALPRH
ncbi:hypothetical protein NBRC111894_4445 [Sporolactobacillus inulinus]|uniref:Uncharacterized protein n=1 Tax=Sporolactobacillus inulinus TaxID=2078 RepID=A0A4Y1ZIS9_9BACL|nr:hypothetical protein NBRC111894_4445 [Sporolactobacillus inulinus]